MWAPGCLPPWFYPRLMVNVLTQGGFCPFLKAAVTLCFFLLLGFSLVSTGLESCWKLAVQRHQLPPSAPWGVAGQAPGCVWVFSAPAWSLTWPLNQAGSSSPPSLSAEAWQTLLLTTRRVLKGFCWNYFPCRDTSYEIPLTSSLKIQRFCAWSPRSVSGVVPQPCLPSPEQKI